MLEPDFPTGEPDQIDEELWEIFEEEAGELLQQLHGRLRDWTSHPQDASRGDACMRTLHTFKGGARLAGAMHLGELAHRLESDVLTLLSRADRQAADVHPLQDRGDELEARFENLRQEQRQAGAAVAAPQAVVKPVAAAPVQEPVAEAPRLVEPAPIVLPQPVRVRLPSEVAWAKFSGHEARELTVAEAVGCALRLYQKNDQSSLVSRNAEILQLVGLSERGNTVVEKLSGGQLRRLGLALELTTDPTCLLCDEVTSGLDPRSEDQILAVLRALADQRAKTVVCVIHNLAKLAQFNTVTVVFEGAVVWQGPLGAMLAHFAIADALELYDRLSEHPRAHWQEKWAAVVAALIRSAALPLPDRWCSYRSACPDR
jgi:ABC-type dipeptide/oligopeptide/nickel transport system ATPase subunit/HPt (histidine-containing phosphotransfer) domain-containing protein